MLPSSRRQGTRFAETLWSAQQKMAMPQDLSDPTRFDPPQINLDKEFEARYWSRILGVSRAELRDAVQAAGTSNIYEVARCTGRPLER